MNRAVVVLRRFYCAMVAMGYLDHAANPLIGFPSIKAVPLPYFPARTFVFRPVKNHMV